MTAGLNQGALGRLSGGSSGTGSGMSTVALGNIGATKTQAVSGDAKLVGTLTANATLTITGMIAGGLVILDVTQDGNGPWTLDVVVSGSTVSMPVSSTGGSLFEIVSPDGTSAHAAALGAGPATATVAGSIKLAGDLGGTSSSPTVPGLTAKMTNPMTTAGDVVLGGASGTPSRLAKGSDNLVLGMDGSTHLPVWMDPIRPDPEKPTAALYETYSRHFAQSSGTFTTGLLILSAIALPKGTVVTSISVLPTTTGTGTHGWAALYDNSAAPALLRQSTDDASVAWTTNTIKTFTLSSTFTTTYSGLHYIGVMVVAGTMPTLVTDQASFGTANQLAPFLSNSANGSLTTTAPATATSLAAQSKQIYGYVS